MTTVPLAAAALATLTASRRMVAVTDDAGQVIGFFAPVGMDNPAGYAEAAAQVYPHKDAHKAADAGKRYTTAEVLAHLQSLETP